MIATIPRAPDRERAVDRVLEGGGRHRDDDELGCAGKLLERGVRRLPEDLAAVAVDEPDVAAIGALEGARGDPLAPLGGVVRGPEDGDRARIEERPQVAHGRSLRPGCRPGGQCGRR